MKLDLAFAAAFFCFAFLGYISGFWMQVMRLGVMIASYMLAGVFGRVIGPSLASAMGIPMMLGQVLGTAVSFFGLYMVLSAVGWGIMRRVRKAGDKEKAAKRKQWDSLLGAAFGGTKIFLIMFLLLNAVVLLESHLESVLKKYDLGFEKSFMVKLARNHNMLSGMHLPVVGDVQSLAKLGSDPKFRQKVANDPKMAELIKHPKIKGLLNDRSIVQASQNQDFASLLGNPRLNKVLADPEIKKLLSEVDFSKIE